MSRPDDPSASRRSSRQALAFVVAVMILALGVRALVPWVGEGVLPLTMLTPALAVLGIALLAPRRPGEAGWLQGLGLRRAGLAAWPLALGAPLLLHAAVLAILAATRIAALRPLSGGAADQALDLTAELVVGTLFALAEELGWRGYLLPRLVTPLGAIRAMMLVGLLHGLWHLPVLLTTPYYHGGADPRVVVPLFLVTLTLAGLFYGHLRLATGSLWPVALAHGAANAAWELFSRLTATRSQAALELWGGESGLLVIAGLAGIGLVVARAWRGAVPAAARPVRAS